MTKNDVINEVVMEMSGELGRESIDKLKVTLAVKLHNFELVASETRPSVEIKDNDWILKRFLIDMMAMNLEKSTIKQYVGMVKKFFLDTGLTYADATGQDIMDYLAIRQYRDKISSSYKATIFRYLRVFFSWAYRKHHIGVDVLRDVDSVKFTRKAKDRLTDEEVERCRLVVKNDAKSSALLELMLSTGMRVGEIASLKVQDLDFQTGEIVIWGEKSNKERIGFMSAPCKVALQRYLDGRTEGMVFEGRNHGGVCNSTIEKIAKGIAEEANCHVKATVHIYRKTFASVTYRKTNDILLVSKLLGHADTETTIKYYLVDDVQDMMYKMRKVA